MGIAQIYSPAGQLVGMLYNDSLADYTPGVWNCPKSFAQLRRKSKGNSRAGIKLGLRNHGLENHLCLPNAAT